ncbi:MAG: hypothetical protein M3417_16595 [Actinomycetota bacterium]|nr:hypothetical protein [Actinomycetota bacterium]
MRRLIAGSVLAVLAFVAGPAAGAGGPAPTAARACSGTITDKINGKAVRARSISTRRTNCRTGKRVIRSFLARADRRQSCNRASKKPPPTSGCRILGFNCFRNGSTYCASPRGRSVMWRE